jgi:hypothetical protein
MSSAFLSTIGECPIDPEEADDKLTKKRKWKENTK